MTESDFNRLVEQIADFCIENDQGRCFPGWPKPKVENFILYHFNHKSILFVKLGGEIVGVSMWWKWKEGTTPLDTEGDYVTPSVPDGDLYYHSDVITTNRDALPAMVRKFKARNPDWDEKDHFCMRRDKRTGALKKTKYNRVLALLGR